jgi:glycosyltransferase involved in cell wall biosynthesis
MRDAPLVTVILPTRDRPALLARAVRSALSQTYRDLEVRVVDDGSDPPVELPDDARRDPRTRLIRTEASRGAATARNLAVEDAGPILAFLDDDDVWFPRKLEHQVPVMLAAGADVAAVECGYEFWDGGRVWFRYVPDPRRDLRRSVLLRPTLYPSSVIMRRSAFEDLGGFDATLDRVEDWELWVRLADRYRVASIPRVLLRRSATTRPSSDVLRWYRVMVGRLEPRIDALAPGDRAEILAEHAFQIGVLYAQAGDRRAARTWLWRALSTEPAPRPALHLARTVVGERVWARMAGVARLARVTSATALRRGAPLRRW